VTYSRSDCPTSLLAFIFILCITCFFISARRLVCIYNIGHIYAQTQNIVSVERRTKPNIVRSDQYWLLPVEYLPIVYIEGKQPGVSWVVAAARITLHCACKVRDASRPMRRPIYVIYHPTEKSVNVCLGNNGDHAAFSLNPSASRVIYIYIYIYISSWV